jgi:hypothetical protein
MKLKLNIGIKEDNRSEQMKINLTPTLSPSFKSLFKLPVETPNGRVDQIEFPELINNRPRVIGDSAYYMCLNQDDKTFKDVFFKKTGYVIEKEDFKNLHISNNYPTLVNSVLKISKTNDDPLIFYWNDLSLIWQNASKHKKVELDDIKLTSTPINPENVEDKHVMSIITDGKRTEGE